MTERLIERSAFVVDGRKQALKTPSESQKLTQSAVMKPSSRCHHLLAQKAISSSPAGCVGLYLEAEVDEVGKSSTICRDKISKCIRHTFHDELAPSRPTVRVLDRNTSRCRRHERRSSKVE